MSEITIRVFGIPRPAGSKSAYIIPRADIEAPEEMMTCSLPEAPPMDVTDGAVQNCVLAGKCLGSKHCRAIVTDASKHIKTWKRAVAEAGRLAAPKTLLDLPLKVFCCFIMPRPKKHYRTGKFSNELRADAPHGHSIAPDALKLMRGTEDALTGIIWKDDCLICDERQTKVYGDKPGAKITISWRDE